MCQSEREDYKLIGTILGNLNQFSTLMFSPNYYNNKRKLKSPNFTGGNLNNDFETDWFQVRHLNALTSREQDCRK
jgi:hypothetical protein